MSKSHWNSVPAGSSEWILAQQLSLQEAWVRENRALVTHPTRQKFTDGWNISCAGTSCPDTFWSLRFFRTRWCEALYCFQTFVPEISPSWCFELQHIILLSKVVKCGPVLLAIRFYVRLLLHKLFNICLYINYCREWPEATNQKGHVCTIRESAWRGCWIRGAEVISRALLRAADHS